MNNVGICYFRSLYSQSACSLSMGKLSDYLLNRGYNTNLYLLKRDDHRNIIDIFDSLIVENIIIYKTNFQDFEYGIRLFKNLLKNYNGKFYVVGPFAIMNKERILKKYTFIDRIIDVQDKEAIDEIFKAQGKRIRKKTIINGIDREIEIKEKGKYINLETSTGCIYNCAFCHINIMNYKKSKKNMLLVVQEIENLYKKLGKRYFIFNDSVFWINSNDNERVNEFIKLLTEKKLNISFMIYLSLTQKISDDLLIRLKKVGLIRIFFGVENISKNFEIQHNKYVSGNDTEIFINKLESLNISYHIGFILFSKNTQYLELFDNINFLYKIKKLFRPGILIEKMRILPSSKDSNCLHENKNKIDQAYNYYIDDSKVEKYYEILNNLFSNINIRNFEQFFSGIKIALTILKDIGKIDIYDRFVSEYNITLDIVNDEMYKILIKELETLEISNSDVEKLKDLYSLSEINYIKFMKYLKETDIDIYETIPHGKEELNVW